jgi:hypothetical protein
MWEDWLEGGEEGGWVGEERVEVTFATTRVLRRKVREVPDLVVDYDPAVLG